MKNLKFQFIIALTITFSINLFADGSARRKNRCTNSEKRYYALGRTKGGSNNCGNAAINGVWSCSGQEADLKLRIENPATPCTCAGDQSNSNKTIAARSQAVSNSTKCKTQDNTYVFGCGFPNKWKGGISSDYQPSPINFPMVINKFAPPDANFEMGSLLDCNDIVFNYTENTISLESFYGELKKNTPDMVNDFATFVIQVSIVLGGNDGTGQEIENIIYNCKATIFNNDLILEDASGNFTRDDFKSHPMGNSGVLYKTKNQTKVIALGTDINEEMEINVSFYSETGNFEEGAGGRFAINPTLIENEIKEIEKTQNVVLKINQNPIVENLNLTIAVKDAKNDKQLLYIKDINGKIVKEVEIPVNSTEQNYSIPMNGFEKGIYFIFLEHNDKEYGKKIIVDKN